MRRFLLEVVLPRARAVLDEVEGALRLPDTLDAIEAAELEAEGYREPALDIACPAPSCGAGVGAMCTDRGERRARAHEQRVDRWIGRERTLSLIHI